MHVSRLLCSDSFTSDGTLRGTAEVLGSQQESALGRYIHLQVREKSATLTMRLIYSES